MRKIIAAFFITLFCLCGVLGFGIATEVKALASHNAQVVIPTTQFDLILVRVNDLSQPNPALVSVWGVFVNQSVTPTITLKQIYPAAASPFSNQLHDAFSLDRKMQLSTRFTDIIHQLQLPGSGPVLVDNFGLGEWAKAVLHQTLTIEPVAPANRNDLAVLQQADQDLFTGICATVNDLSNPGLTIPTATSHVAAIAAAIDPPDYFRKWMGLVTSLHFASCEVLAGP
ncbi:MAG TPA: hypothetical protein VMS73_08675 [Anaerolineaceae bacterium]|nr:hypothetical protein [Anaerolineaceae bacterium]